MKKIVVILLAVLPIILIYLISFAGKIMVEYNPVSVEKIALVDENNQEYKNGSTIKINLNEPYELKIKIYPEVASNKDVLISIAKPDIISIDDDYKAMAKAYGTSKVVITSKDNTSLFIEVYLKVSEDDIQRIEVDKDDVTLEEDESIIINTTIYSSETLPGNRNLIWSSKDPSIASVNRMGKITAHKEGTTEIIVCSDYRKEIKAVIKVTVHKEVLKEIYFDIEGKVYETKNPIINLNSLIKTTVSGYEDLTFKIMSNFGSVDPSCHTNGVIKDGQLVIIKGGFIKVRVSITYNGVEIYDEIFVSLKS